MNIYFQTQVHTLQIFTFYISEPYVEALPTVLILLALAFRNYDLVIFEKKKSKFFLMIFPH